MCINYLHRNIFLLFKNCNNRFILSPSRYVVFKKLKNKLKLNNYIEKFDDELIINQSYHQGGNIFVYICKPFRCVQFRKFNYDVFSDRIYPTKKGISIKFNEWDRFLSHLETIEILYPVFVWSSPCKHESLNSFYSCAECCPQSRPYFPEIGNQ